MKTASQSAYINKSSSRSPQRLHELNTVTPEKEACSSDRSASTQNPTSFQKQEDGHLKTAHPESLRPHSNVHDTVTLQTHKGCSLNVPIAESPLVTNISQNDNGRPECSRYLSRVTTTEMSHLFLSLKEWK